MPRYDMIWKALVERTVAQAVVDLESFVALALESGMSQGALTEALDDDLENNGPIFGKFIRGLEGASSSSVMAAARQGEMMGTINASRELERLTRIAGFEGDLVDAINNADPAAADFLESEIMNDQTFTWVAELINTCERCLPLHGSSLTLAEWRERGLLPETIHAGWTVSCKCRLVPTGLAEGREELLSPLRRVKLKTVTGKEGERSTERAVSASDIDSARAARDKALETKGGRRTLRILGQAGVLADEGPE